MSAIGRALKRRSLAELGDRALQAARAAIERAGLSGDTAPAAPDDWRSELRDASGRPFPDAAAALAAFRASAPACFFTGTADIAATVAAIRALDPAAPARTQERAAEALAGRDRLLGHDALEFGSPRDWHLDPVNRRRAPLAHWSRVPYLDERAVGDHKVIWELNRHQWLVHLAKAWHFTGEARWAEAALAQVDAWIDANPAKRGINWASSLEVALRGIAWLWVLHLLRDAPALTERRFARMARVLALGGRHVEQHLSTWFSPNTHLTGEALGLLYLGCALPGLAAAPRWRRRGLAILAEWMPRHVRGDGTYIEQSTHYARYTADFLIHAVALARRSGEVPPALVQALRRAAGFLRHVCRPDGSLPLIGDDDGGRVLFLDPAPADDVRPTLGAAAALLGEATLAFLRGTPSEEIAWLLGPEALRAQARGPRPLPAEGSRLFAEGGVATLRDGWDAEASLAVLDCGLHGMGNGGHAHADLGSFDLTLRGRRIVVDPGTASYLSGAGLRDAFRAASAHAVPTVDAQGSAATGAPFSWLRTPRVLDCTARLRPECDIVAFSHDGFQHLQDPVTHRRSLIRVRRDYWLLVDEFQSLLAHDVSISYPLAPGLRARFAGAQIVIHDATADVARFAAATPAPDWRCVEASASNAYGRLEPALRLVQCARLAGELTTATLIQPAGEAPLALHLEGGAGARELIVECAVRAPEVLRFGADGLRYVGAR